VDPVEILQAELLSRIPQARLHVLPGTGHLSPLESPQGVAEAIDHFVATLV
jgi:pimeloyl-ACP methyl ester carboxylesterase